MNLVQRKKEAMVSTEKQVHEMLQVNFNILTDK